MNINDDSNIFIFNVFNSNLNINYKNINVISYSYNSNNNNITSVLQGDQYASNYYFNNNNSLISSNNCIKYNADNHIFNGNLYVGGMITASSYSSNVVVLNSNNKIDSRFIPAISPYGIIKTGKFMGIGTNSPQSKFHVSGGDIFIDSGRLGINTQPAFSLHINETDINLPTMVLSSNNIYNLIGYANRPFLGIGTNSYNYDDTNVSLYSCGKIMTNDFNITRNGSAILYYDVYSNLISRYPIQTPELVGINNNIITNSDITVKGTSVYNNIIKVPILTNSIVTINNRLDNYTTFNNYININNSNLKLGNDNGMIYNNGLLNVKNISTSNLLNSINIYNDGLLNVKNIYSSSDNLSFLSSDNNLYYYNNYTSTPIQITTNTNLSLIKSVNSKLVYYNNSNLYEYNSANSAFNQALFLRNDLIDFSYGLETNTTIYYIDKFYNLYYYGYNYNIKNYNSIITLTNTTSFTLINYQNIKFTKVECGYNFVILLDNNNNLYSFGKNDIKQLGRISNYYIDSIGLIPLTSTSKIISISCGKSHTLILYDDGSVWSFGDINTNSRAKKGYYNDTTNVNDYLPKQIIIPEKIIKIKCSNDNSILLSANNNIYISGDINTNYNNSPIYLIPNITNIIDISCGIFDYYLLSCYCDIYRNTSLINLPSNFYNVSVKSRGSITVGSYYINNNNIPSNSLIVQNFIGIGTNVNYDPTYSLIINGNINLTGDIYKNGVLFNPSSSSPSSFSINNWNNNNNQKIYYNLGNVGIGTTNPAKKLEIYGDLSIVGGDIFKNGVLFNLSNNNNDNDINIYYGTNSNIGINTSKANYPFDLYDSSFSFTNIVFSSNVILLDKLQLNVNFTPLPQINNSIAISGDGSTIVGSISEYNSSTTNTNNIIYIYKNNFKQIITTPSKNILFGSDIKVSYDGSIVLIGCYNDYDIIGGSIRTNHGSIYLYTNNDYTNYTILRYNDNYSIGNTFTISKNAEIIYSLIYANTNDVSLSINSYNNIYKYTNNTSSLISFNYLFHQDFNNQSIDTNDDGSIFVVGFNYNDGFNYNTYYNIYIHKNNTDYLLLNYNSDSTITNVSISGDGTKLLISIHDLRSSLINYDVAYLYYLDDNYINIDNNGYNYYNIAKPNYIFSLPITNNNTTYKSKISKDGNFITTSSIRSKTIINYDSSWINNDNNLYTYRYNYITKSWINNNTIINNNKDNILDNINFDISYYGFNSAINILNKDTNNNIIISDIISSKLYNNKSLIYGCDGNLTFGSNIIPNKNIDFYFNGITYASVMKSPNFDGYGSNISNILLNNIVTTNSNIRDCLIFTHNSGVSYSCNLYWNNDNSNLIVDGTIIASNIINLNQKPVFSELDSGQIFFGDYTSNYAKASSNLLWNNQTSNLIINGTVNSKYFKGDGSNITNIRTSNIVGVLEIINGGSGLHYIEPGAILFGNTYYSMDFNTDLLKWDNNNSNLIVNSTITTNGMYINNLIASNINGMIYTSNGGTGNDSFPHGCIIYGNNKNPLSYDSNIIWNSQTSNLIINGNINANQFYGSGFNISNIVSSNIIGVLNVNQGGTGMSVIQPNSIPFGASTTSLRVDTELNYDATQKLLTIGANINRGAITVSIINTANGITAVNAYLLNANIKETVNVSKGGTGNNIINPGCILYGSNNNNLGLTSNFIWNEQTSNLIIGGSINASGIISADTLIGKIATSNIIGVLNVNQGGTGNSNIFSGFIPFGNGMNSLSTDSNLIWNSQSSNLIVNGIIASNITSKYFQGDGTYINNIIASNINGILPVSRGGTGNSNIFSGFIPFGNGMNPLSTDSNLIWNSQSSNLIVNGIIASNITSKYFQGDGTYINNIIASNINGIFPISKGGTGNSNIFSGFITFGNGMNPLSTDSNLIWNSQSSNLIVTNITCSNITAKYFQGDGSLISNITTSNINGIVSIFNGGTGNSNIPYGNIIIGNENSNLLFTSNLLWANNTLLINNLLANPGTSLNVNGNVNISGDIYKNNVIYVPFNGWSNLEKSNTVYTSSNILINYNVSDPNYMLKVNGNIYASGDIVALSDEKYKNNIISINDPLQKVESLRGVYFNRNDVNPSKRSIGLIAQEVEQIIPEVIINSVESGKSIAYGNLVGLLIEAIKELSNKIKILENK